MSNTNNKDIKLGSKKDNGEETQNVTIKDVLNHFTGKQSLSKEQQEKLMEISKEIRNIPGL